MKILGLYETLNTIFSAPTKLVKMKFVAARQLPKPKPASNARKKHRKMVEASRRRNR